jgi:hypothetical protein
MTRQRWSNCTRRGSCKLTYELSEVMTGAVTGISIFIRPQSISCPAQGQPLCTPGNARRAYIKIGWCIMSSTVRP